MSAIAHAVNRNYIARAASQRAEWSAQEKCADEPKLISGVALTTSGRRLRDSNEERLLAARGRMVHGIAHDIRHYLSIVLANIEMLAGSRIPDYGREEAERDIRNAIDESCDLLDLTLLSPQDRRHLPAAWESLDEIATYAIRMAKCHPDGRHSDISLNHSRVYCQKVVRTLLISGIFNLVLNACQASMRGNGPGKVEVTLRRMKSVSLFRISDNGPGIPESLRAQALAGEIGLGIANAERAARAHGGSLYLEESSPGRTVFALTIPVAQSRSRFPGVLKW